MTQELREDRRHLYGLLLTLPEFREAYHGKTGYCRGCRAVYPGTDLKAKGVQCTCCGKPRVFGALQYAWNGWIGDLPPGRYRGRSLERLIASDMVSVTNFQTNRVEPLLTQGNDVLEGVQHD